MVCIYSTPRKINMEPDKNPLKEESHHSSKPSFTGSMLIFGGVPTFTKNFSAEFRLYHQNWTWHVQGPRVWLISVWIKNVLERQVCYLFRQLGPPNSSNYCLKNRALGFPGMVLSHPPIHKRCFRSLQSQVTTCIAFQLLWRFHLVVKMGSFVIGSGALDRCGWVISSPKI